MTTALLWFRRDLRLADHPALVEALASADQVVPAFVLDPVLLGPAGAPRVAFLFGCLDDLHRRTGGALVLRSGDPVEQIPRLAEEVEASEVFVTEDFGPYGARRDDAVAGALAAAGRQLVAVGTPYAVAPGVLRTGSGTPFKVFTPYYRAWRAHGADAPLPVPDDPAWARGVGTDALPSTPDLGGGSVLAPGEDAAKDRLAAFVGTDAARYGERRDLPATAGTSRLSVYLKYGCLHPRQVLARLGRGPGPDTFRSELAWRDFYAGVLAERPESARRALRPVPGALRVDEGPEADARFAAWAEGRTGYPLVDAGMRQLLGECWMHNRVRMVVASFLVKDLHLDWRRGARHFMRHLQDGDLASNNHGWQWVAGTGTDAAPFHRIFNPVSQGRRFDPSGDYIRRWVPELRGIPGGAVHEPWKLAADAQRSLFEGGGGAAYPPPLVDHAVERREALARFEEARDVGAAASGP
jgi:deoxyribodipyrimidine photo-lyase